MDQATKTDAAIRNRKTLRRVLMFSMPLAAVALCLLPNGPVLKMHTSPSESMAPAIPLGSHFFVSRLPYGLSRYSYNLFHLPIDGRWPDWRPLRGDIVTFKHPKETTIDYLKRVIALPGERVALKRGRLLINDVMVPRDLITVEHGKSPKETKYMERLPATEPHTIFELDGDQSELDSMPEVLVPEGHVFVMGDNRDHSMDSRTPLDDGGLGPVPLRNIVGKVVLVIPPTTSVSP